MYGDCAVPTVRSVPPRGQARAQAREQGLQKAREIGARLVAARLAAGMDQKDVAREMATVDYRTLEKWEEGVDRQMEASQRTVSRLERGEVGESGGGKNPSLYVGPGVHLLHCYGQAAGIRRDPLLVLTAGIYHDETSEESLESRILRDSTLTKPEKDGLLSLLTAFRRPR